jgi:hypothetical protein
MLNMVIVPLGTITIERNILVYNYNKTQLKIKTKTDQHATYKHTQISSNSSTIAADNSTGTYIIHYSIELIAFSAEYTLFYNCNFNAYGSVHLNNILVYNSNMMHKLQSLYNLIIALHVSGVTITHPQEHKTTVTTASGNRYTVLLSAAFVEELYLI